jgi:hypothetical protein
MFDGATALVQRSKEAGLGLDFSPLLFLQARRVHRLFFGFQSHWILVEGFDFSFGFSNTEVLSVAHPQSRRSFPGHQSLAVANKTT